MAVILTPGGLVSVGTPTQQGGTIFGGTIKRRSGGSSSRKSPTPSASTTTPGQPGFVGPVKPTPQPVGPPAPSSPEGQRLIIEKAARSAPSNQFGSTTTTTPTKEFEYRDEKYIEKRVVGQTKDVKTGRIIPITKLVVVDPTGRGEQKERPVTLEERKSFNEQTSNLVIIKKETGASGILQESIKFSQPIILMSEKQLNVGLKESITLPVGAAFGDISGRLGFAKNLDEAGRDIKRTSELLEDRGFSPKFTDTGEFIAGVGVETTRDIFDKPLKQIVLVGAGVGVGAGLKAVSIGTKFIPGTVGAVTSTTFKGGVIVGGVGLAALETGRVVTEVSAQDSAFSKGGVVGVAVKDLSLIGAGGVVGERLAIKGVGYARTIGTKDLPAEQVIAPEFFAGERYPTIKKGQTAGELQAEFFEPVLPGEVGGVGRGFTATGDLFAKKTVIQKGTSEVPGLFQAPKVSATFLRLGGEKEIKFIGLDSLSGGTPTILRATPESIGFQPGITTRTKAPTGLYDKAFFKQIEGSGESFIPFAKTEKESIISFGSKVGETQKRFSIKFEGVRIPIQESKITPSGKTVKSKPLLSEVVTSVSESRIKPSVVISPSRLIASSIMKLPSSSITPSVSSPVRSRSSSSRGRRSTPSSSSLPSISSSSFSSSSSSGFSPGSPSSSSSGLSSRRTPPSSRSSFPRDTFIPPPTFNFKLKGTSKRPPLKTFTVFEKRGGIFRPLSITGRVGRAVTIGSTKVRRSPSVQFKITGPGTPGTIKGFKGLGGGIFQELPKLKSKKRKKR